MPTIVNNEYKSSNNLIQALNKQKCTLSYIKLQTVNITLMNVPWVWNMGLIWCLGPTSGAPLAYSTTPGGTPGLIPDIPPMPGVLEVVKQHITLNIIHVGASR